MKRLLAAVLTAALAACSAANSIPSNGPGTPAGAAGRSASRGGKIHTAMVVRVPKKPHRRGHYVSPSTQSGQLVIAPADGCTTCSPLAHHYFGLTADSPNCTFAAGGLVCTIPLVLNPGDYTGTVALSDGPLKNGANSGKVLSADQSLNLTIAAGHSNVPQVTLYGAPANVMLTSLDSQAYIGYGNQLFNELLQIVAKSRARIQIYATDPDGNVILGPGSPTFTIAPTKGFSLASLGDNIYSLTAPAPFRGTASLQLTISSPACSEPYAACGSIDAYGISAGVYSSTATSNGTDTVYVTSANTATPVTITQGISGPGALAFDSKGNLWVANHTGNTIAEYAYPYTAGPLLTLSNGVNAPVALAFDSSDDLFVANSGGISAYAVQNGYSAAPFNLTGTSGATGLAVDSKGKLWASYPTGILRFPAPLSSATNDQAFLSSTPTQICLDSSDDVYVISNGKISNFVTANGSSYSMGSGKTLPSSITAIATFHPGDGSADAIAAGTAADLNYMHVSPSGFSTVTTYASVQGANALAFDQYGAAWASQPSYGSVSWENHYVPSGGYFPADGATGVAAFP